MASGDFSLALTGVGLCFPIITLISAFINWISTGAAPLCSMARGQKDSEESQRIHHLSYAIKQTIIECRRTGEIKIWEKESVKVIK